MSFLSSIYPVPREFDVPKTDRGHSTSRNPKSGQRGARRRRGSKHASQDQDLEVDVFEASGSGDEAPPDKS